MRRSRAIANAVVGLSGVVALAPAAYLAVLSLAAARSTRLSEPKTHESDHLAPHLTVLVPAHNEEVLLGRCLRSLSLQTYPRDCYRVAVIADNCTDATAEVARSLGATVLERKDLQLPGKGHALKWAMDQVLHGAWATDAFVVVDADSVVHEHLLVALASAHRAGADVAQADYEALVEGSDDRAQLRAAAFLLFHRVRFTGKARLGLPCSLVGNGMLFSRRVVEEHPWSAYSEVEDLEYTLQLRMAGVRPVFVPDATLVAPVSVEGRGAEVQRHRWEGGRARVARQHLPTLLRLIVREGRTDLWDAGADLAVPPLGLLAAGTSAGGAVAALLWRRGAVGASAVAPWLLALMAMPSHVLLGLKAVDAPPQMARALRSAPSLVLQDSRTRLSALSSDTSRQWVRTPRSASIDT